MKQMNKVIAVLLFLCFMIFPLCAETKAEGIELILQRKLSNYPEVLVKYGEKTVTKSAAIEFLKYQNLQDVDDEEFADRLKDIVNEKIYLEIISFFLERYNFKPSYQMAYKYLSESQGKLPPELMKIHSKSNSLEELAADKNYQLTVAALMYLKKHYPDTTKVTPGEIEFFYRVNQNVFMYDAKVSVNFLAVEKKLPNAKELINHAFSQLRQGVSFDKLAETFNVNLPKKFYEPAYQAEILAKAAELEGGEYSEILEFEDSFAIVMVKNREAPKYIPLKHAEFFIQSIIESRKCAVELEKILEKALQLIDIEYFF